MKAFRAIVTKIDAPLYDGDALSATLTTTEGEITVLADHEPFVAPLKKGNMVLRTAEGDKTFEVESGVVEISGGTLHILI